LGGRKALPEAVTEKEIIMRNDKVKYVLAGTFVLALAACGTTNRTPASASQSTPVAGTGAVSSASGYGVVQSVESVPREQRGVGMGTAAGAVVGGLLGNQVGSGRGRTAATVAGVAGGALAGREMQRNSQAADSPVYRIVVRMDNGSLQNLTQETQPNLQIGERVRLDNGVIVERGR
jgi:outer membrane lipoprotein SlyB